MSRLIPFLNLLPIALARRLHLTLSYWSLVLMAVHLGLHLQMIVSPLKRRLITSSKRLQTIVLTIIPYLLTIYGLMMFIKNQIIAYLFLSNDYVMVDSSDNLIQHIIEYLGIIGLFGLLTYKLVLSIRKK